MEFLRNRKEEERRYEVKSIYEGKNRLCVWVVQFENHIS